MRANGEPLPYPDRRLAIGSSTKSFTALLAAEHFPKLPRGYDTTLAELAPRLGLDPRKDLSRKLRGITLTHLFTHTAGMPGKSWQELVRSGIYGKLGMEDCDFTSNHPHPNGGEFTPEIIDPAAAVYCPTEDWLKYLRFHSDVARGKPRDEKILSDPSGYAKLSQAPLPPLDRTFGGWQREPEFIKHFGSNGGYLSISMADADGGTNGAVVAVLTEKEWDEGTFDEIEALARAIRDELRR